jgi:hypothetical protein
MHRGRSGDGRAERRPGPSAPLWVGGWVLKAGNRQ